MSYSVLQSVKKGDVLRNQHGCRYLVTYKDKNGCDAEVIDSPHTRRPVEVGKKVWIDGRDIAPGRIEPEGRR